MDSHRDIDSASSTYTKFPSLTTQSSLFLERSERNLLQVSGALLVQARPLVALQGILCRPDGLHNNGSSSGLGLPSFRNIYLVSGIEWTADALPLNRVCRSSAGALGCLASADYILRMCCETVARLYVLKVAKCFFGSWSSIHKPAVLSQFLRVGPAERFGPLLLAVSRRSSLPIPYLFLIVFLGPWVDFIVMKNPVQWAQVVVNEVRMRYCEFFNMFVWCSFAAIFNISSLQLYFAVRFRFSWYRDFKHSKAMEMLTPSIFAYNTSSMLAVGHVDANFSSQTNCKISFFTLCVFCDNGSWVVADGLAHYKSFRVYNNRKLKNPHR